MDILLPVGAVIDLEASLPAVKKFVSLLFNHCVEQCRKVKHHAVRVLYGFTHMWTHPVVILCRRTFLWSLPSSLFVRRIFFCRTGGHFLIAIYCRILEYVLVVMVMYMLNN